MRLARVTRARLLAFVAQHHRHAAPPRQTIVKVGLEVDGEISRVCLAPGEWPNACSRIYGALCRAARAQGFRRAVTYTLEVEPGTSPTAAGFARVALCPARSWQGERRSQLALLPAPAWESAVRVRWERAL